MWCDEIDEGIGGGLHGFEFMYIKNLLLTA